MPAVRIAAADAGYSLPVVTAGEKVFSNSLDPFEAKLPEIIGILLIIPATEEGKAGTGKIGKLMIGKIIEEGKAGTGKIGKFRLKIGKKLPFRIRTA